jgi:hypothetical protein
MHYICLRAQHIPSRELPEAASCSCARHTNLPMHQHHHHHAADATGTSLHTASCNVRCTTTLQCNHKCQKPPESANAPAHLLLCAWEP